MLHVARRGNGSKILMMEVATNNQNKYKKKKKNKTNKQHTKSNSIKIFSFLSFDVSLNENHKQSTNKQESVQ